MNYMKSSLSHLQINIDLKNLDFYKEFIDQLGMEVVMEGDGYIGYKGKNGVMIFFVQAIKNVEGDYDTKGINHVSFSADSVKEVDKIVEWLTGKKIKSLFDTPRHRPDFAEDETTTYYQVMFETPDKILFEVVYTGKK